ncbi:intraflagellar transport protein 22 homolog [Agrilus planipennis]|uniref:Intraflagellar transport protein 22 homolog n=1 Tax=Agrilus planipennis TaxID=224129 RepID=A0A1W4XA72_AGRPL|nr:intraflagellar transport protein 22 homolog [Agrilus planipennis]
MVNYKVRITLVGPSKSGKSKLANYIADINCKLPEELHPTKGLRILEYDINNVKIRNEKSTVDVQLWDTSGNDEYSQFWPVFSANTDGLVFIHSNDENAPKKLDLLYNYFVNQKNISPRVCLVCSFSSEEIKYNLSSKFSKIAQINVDLEGEGEKFKQEFQKYVLSVVNNLDNQ